MCSWYFEPWCWRIEHFSGGGGLGWRKMHCGMWGQIEGVLDSDEGGVDTEFIEHGMGGDEDVVQVEVGLVLVGQAD